MDLSPTLQKITAVVVTGGSSGIGKAFIENIHSLHPSAAFCNLSRTKPSLEHLPDLQLHHIPCDMSVPEAIQAVFPRLENHLEQIVGSGEILLINNSGIGCYGPSQEIPFDQQLKMLDLNLRGLVQLTGLMLPRLLQSGGTILNVASTAAFQPTPQLAAYGASKAFVLHWSLALGNDLRKTRVRCLCLCPGPTETNFFKAAGFADAPLAGFGQAVDPVVREALRALARGRPLVVTGWLNKLACLFGPRLFSKALITRLAGTALRQVRKP